MNTAVGLVKNAVKTKIKLWLAGILIPVVLVVLAMVLVLSLIAALTGATGATVHSCSPSGDSRGAGETAQMSVDERQKHYARILIGVAKNMGFGEHAEHATRTALMTVAQESRFANYANDGVWMAGQDTAVTAEQLALVGAASQKLPHDAVGTDNDSVGLFQQRPWAGWATHPGTPPGPDTLGTHVQRLMHPVWSAQVFYLRLRGIGGWQTMEPAQLAQTIQVSGYPGAYARHQPLADALIAAHQDAPALALLPESLTPAPADPATGGAQAKQVGLCTGPAGGTSPGGGAGKALAAARSQIGLPYSWGGGGPHGPSLGCGCTPYPHDRTKNGFDCSGLTSYAVYQATGITIPRKASMQWINAPSWGAQQLPYTSPGQLQAGDLVFFSDTSSPSDIYHVVLATGHDTYVEASGSDKGILEQPAWTTRTMFVARPPYGA